MTFFDFENAGSEKALSLLPLFWAAAWLSPCFGGGTPGYTAVLGSSFFLQRVVLVRVGENHL